MDISQSFLDIGTLSDVDISSMKREAKNHKYIAFASLTLVLWEYMIALKDEVRFIWRCRSRKTKATYVFARYFTVAYMFLNVALTFKWTSRFPVPNSMCLRWYILHTSAFSAQYVASHISLLKRVLDLNKGRDVAFIFVAYHLAELVGAFFSSKGTVTALEFDATCHSSSVPKDVFLFLGLFVSGQTMIWSLIIRRIWQPDGRDSPHLDVRAKLYRIWNEGDGKAAWAVCFIGLIFNTINSYVRQRVEPTYIFGWPIAFLSIATCRYILSLEKEAYIRSRFSHPNSKGKERAMPPSDDIEDGIEITTTVNPAVPSGSTTIGHRFSKRSRSQSTIWSNPDYLHPIGLHSLATIASTLRTEQLPEIVIHTSPTNSIMSYERRRSRTASIETRETEQTEITTPSSNSVASMRSPDRESDIDIGSMHTSSSMNSEELRDFWNETWNRTPHQAGSFIG